MYQYFIWNGVNSLDMGVVMLKAPSIFIPQRKINEIKVSGRNGVLHEDEKTYQNCRKEESRLILHMLVMLISADELSPLAVPIICHVLSKPSITVSAPVCGSTETEPSIIVVMTNMSIGITRQIPIMI